MARIPPEQTMKVLPWMFTAQTVDDREGFLREGMQMFPREQFRGMTHPLSTAVPVREWQEMVRWIPELA